VILIKVSQGKMQLSVKISGNSEKVVFVETEKNVLSGLKKESN
jgi:hypothetical protein